MSGLNEVVREQVAGAARALWMAYGDQTQEFLESPPWARITHYQANTLLIANGAARGHLTLMGYAMLCKQRREVAGAARYLVENRGATQEWLRAVRPGQIFDAAEHAKRSDDNLGKFVEVRQCIKERDSTVADAAEWLYHNRGVRIQSFAAWAPSAIVRVAMRCKQSDEVRKDARTYTLAEMREAYRQGFLAATDDEKRAVKYIAGDEYAKDRDAALGRI